jgi:hypothetical protein
MSEWQLSKDAYDLLLNKITRIEGLLEAQNGRIGKLERWRSFLAGGWGATIVLVGWRLFG